MDSIIDAGLRNAALAVPLAALVLVLGLVARRPALLHVLWIVVLLRLVLPPVWNVAVPRLAPAEPIASAEAAPLVNEPPASIEPPATPVAAEEDLLPIWWRLALDAKNDAAPVAEPVLELAPLVETVVPAEPSAPQSELLSWRIFAGTAWLLGSVAIAMLTFVRLGRFTLALRAVSPVTRSVQAETDEIARRLGLRFSPRVVIVNARVSPMLWGFVGRPKLVLPAALWSALAPAQRSTLLAHELAHYGRGDHWARWLELIATILFWWHPVVWLARRQLREAEEQCCDAWVVWALPDSRRAYATTLVDTVGFLSACRPGLPALASGVGQVRNLRRRLTMIMRGNTPRRLPRLALAALFGGGLALATLAPTWAQDRRDPPPAERREDNRRDTRPGESGRDEPRRSDSRRDERSDRDRSEARAELERARAEFERARQRLEELERRLNQRDSDRPRNTPPADTIRGEPGRPSETGRPSVPGVPALPRSPNSPTPPGAPGAFPGRREGGGIEQRMDALERRLDEVTRLLEEMRREQRGRGTFDRGGGSGGAGGGRGGPGRGPGGGGGEGGSASPPPEVPRAPEPPK